MHDLIRPDASFTPRELFARMQGAWFEPRLGSMWQENTGLTPENIGVTPVTTGGQSVGQLLDQSQGMVMGPELVTNGDFSNGTTGWTTGTGISITNNTAVYANAPHGANLGQGVSFTAGTYKIEFDVLARTSGAITIYVNYTTGFPTVKTGLALTTGRIVAHLPITGSGTGFVLQADSLGGYGACIMTIDNISVRQVLGNHAAQSSASLRPTYQVVNNLPLLRHDANDTLVASLPNLNGGVFSNAGSVYFSTPSGMSCLHNKSIGTSYNLPAPNTDIYGVVITPARLVPPLEQRLALYMHRLAGLSDADFFWQEQATDGMTGQLLTDDGTILFRG